MWQLLARPFIFAAEKVGLRTAASGATAAAEGAAARTVAVGATETVAKGAADVVAKPSFWMKTKNFFGFGAGGAAAEGGMSFVGKAATEFGKKGLWGKTKDIAIIAAVLYVGYKAVNWLFGSKKEETVSPQAQMMSAPAVAPLQPAMGIAPQWGVAAGQNAGLAYTAGVGDAQLMQQQTIAQPQTNWQNRVGGQRGARGSYVEQYQAQQAAAAMNGQYVGA